MRRFLIKASLFFIFIFVMGIVLDVVLCKGLLKMEDYRFQDYAAMLQGGMKHDVLIMGNSRGKSHFDTRIIDSLCNVSSFCIGIGGYPFNLQLAKYHLYREHNEKPALIIQNVDHGTLAYTEDVRRQHQSEQFFPLIYDSVMRDELKELGYGFRELNLPLYRFIGYQQVIKNGLLEALHLKHYISRPAYKGYRPEEGEWDGTELTRMEAYPIVFSDKSKALFEEYLDQCKADSIKVVLVYSPMYVGAMIKMIGLDKAKQYFREQAESRSFVYLDYTDNCPISQDTSNFCVAVHMNPEATRRFTQMFCDTLAHL